MSTAGACATSLSLAGHYASSSAYVMAQRSDPDEGGSHQTGIAFRVLTFGSCPIAPRIARKTAPCPTTSTTGGRAMARLIAATDRAVSATKVSAPSGVNAPVTHSGNHPVIG